jgi:thermitase
MQKKQETHIVVIALTALVTIWAGWSWLDESLGVVAEEGSLRLPSLGTPQVVQKKQAQESKVIMNDPALNRNWGLQGSDKDASIKIDRAWNISQGSRDIIVAVIDTGVDASHPDLKKNLWVNKGETGKDISGRDKATNGIDDDKNGFIDDVHGWNFVTHTSDLADNHGHGTHIAGIVGAEGGNGIGTTGIAPKVSLMVLKYYDPKARGTDNLKNTIKAIEYAVANKAHIINYSGGGLDFSQPEFEAVKKARDAGILFIAAAGNERSNSDYAHYYPANYPLSNIISVTAINKAQKVLSSSNFGVETVHIAAPGEGIFSTLPKNRYGYMTGTSQATAFVTGVAALIMSNNREFSYKQVRTQILETSDRLPGMEKKTKTAGVLNSWAALAMQPQIPVTGIVASNTNDTRSFRQAQPGQNLRNQLNNLGSLLNNLRSPAQR